MTPAEEFAHFQERFSTHPRLGCSLVAHRDLGFCAACQRDDGDLREIAGWRSLAMVERGIPRQPSEKDEEHAHG